MTWSRRPVAAVLALALAAGLLVPGLAAPAAADPTAPPAPAPRLAAAAVDQTSAKERKRVDSVKKPKIRWASCYGKVKCATVKLPRDYDKRSGAKVKVALLKRPARDKARRIGTLFVNPGGPGGSGIEMAFYANQFLSKDVLDRFDIVGFDPRGTNASQQVRCFSSTKRQSRVVDKLEARPFPVSAAEIVKVREAASDHAKACSTRKKASGKAMAGAMSTAEVARDLDVLRRAVGDAKLSFLGFSYGSYLGQVYANLFPDRVRTVVIDGVIDPIRWAGRTSTKSVPVGDRLRSADASTKALHEILVRCQRVGPTKCEFAGRGNPITNFDLIARTLHRTPIVDTDPMTGEKLVFGYAELVSAVLGSLYSEFGYAEIDYSLARLYDLVVKPPVTARAAKRTSAIAGLKRTLAAIADRQQTSFAKARLAYPYDNSLDAFEAVSCTDTSNTKNLAGFGSLSAAAERRAKYFGRLWLWNQAQCSSTKWKVKDEDAYRGPFTRRTARAVLVVGNTWDPATSYAGAQTAARLLPNSRLLTSNSWGHTAYNTSSCVTGAVDRYLLAGQLPAVGAVCTGDIQPFVRVLDTERTTATDLGLLRAPAQVPYGLR